MATAQSPIARQPDQLDYASPTQFRFGVHQLPKVEFFTVSANLPGISAGVVTHATPFKDILSLIHIRRCRRYAECRSRWSPYH